MNCIKIVVLKCLPHIFHLSKKAILWRIAELHVSVKIFHYATKFQHSLTGTWTQGRYTQAREKSPTSHPKVLISPEETENPVSTSRKHMANSSTPTSLHEYIWCGWYHVDEKTNCEKCHFSKINWLPFSGR